MMEFIALGHNCSLNHRGESGIEAGQIMGSGGINSSEEEEEVQDSVVNTDCEGFELATIHLVL